jgi:ribosomal protein S27AE
MVMLEKAERCPDCGLHPGMLFNYDAQFCGLCGWSAFPSERALDFSALRRAMRRPPRRWQRAARGRPELPPGALTEFRKIVPPGQNHEGEKISP